MKENYILKKKKVSEQPQLTIKGINKFIIIRGFF